MKFASFPFLSFAAIALVFTHATSATLIKEVHGAESRELRPGGGRGRFGDLDCSSVGETMPEEGTMEFRQWAHCQPISFFECDTVDLTGTPPAGGEVTLESVTFRRCQREAFRQQQEADLDCTGVIQGGDPPARDGSGAFRTWVRCQDWDCEIVDLTQPPPSDADILDRIEFRACRREARRNGTLP